VQQPSGQGNTSGGERQFVAGLARAACAMGVSGVFIETHQDPDNAPCDGPNMIAIDHMGALMDDLLAFDALRKGL
jgi:2-dehydro-3-deoxyphosphooctonate aldolase (KDO 8-P synthase)